MSPTPTQFHAFTIKYNGLVNRIITDISLSQAFDPKNPPDQIDKVQTKALWDTGATGSVLTHSIVGSLGLIPAGTALVDHAGGSSQCNTYLINVYLPNKVAIAGVLVSDCPDKKDFGAIIGMDIISQGDFALTNFKGQTWLSFRIPSIQSIDYVVEANKINFGRTGRNEPCPCGKKDPSGKPVKFKHCHGKQ